MATDVIQRFVEAAVAVLRAYAPLKAELGRSDRVVTPWQPLDAAPLPVLFYTPVLATQFGGVGDTRVVQVQFTAVADGPGSQAKANAIMEHVENALTQPALAGQSVDAAPRAPWSRRYVAPYGTVERDGGRGLSRSDLDATFIITK